MIGLFLVFILGFLIGGGIGYWLACLGVAGAIENGSLKKTDKW